MNTDKRPLILISNDDSIAAPGLKVLIDCVSRFGDIIAVAPAEPHSGQSAAFTVSAPLRILRQPNYNGARMYAVTGTPVDCVKLAMHHIVPRRPDLMLSGVNHGSNAGNSEIYSGTMGAAFEACMQGIPAVGYSLLHHAMDADFSQTLPYITSITEKVLANGLPQGICLNVNFPSRVAIEGARVCRSARSHWTEEYHEYLDPHGKPYWWLTGSMVNDEPESTDTDLYWLDRRYASIVPVCPDRNVLSAIPALASLLDK